MRDLHAQLLAAHRAKDLGRLVNLYQAAARGPGAATLDERAFFLTHAYVHALEAGDERVAALHAELKRLGREE